jgi:heme/copper-type cytochrome/quinol oxidase subunit 3
MMKTPCKRCSRGRTCSHEAGSWEDSRQCQQKAWPQVQRTVSAPLPSIASIVTLLSLTCCDSEMLQAQPGRGHHLMCGLLSTYELSTCFCSLG